MDVGDNGEGFGLAGAEQRLINLQLDQGRLAVQRQILQLRVDYLTNLNTQTMLLAGAAVGMLSSLELEAIQPEEEERRRMIITATYIFCSSISLGSSIWVLYTSNNLINLATMSALQAERLSDVQGADNILALRMKDVRRMYISPRRSNLLCPSMALSLSHRRRPSLSLTFDGLLSGTSSRCSRRSRRST